MAMLDCDYTARQRDFTTCFFAAMQLSFRNGSRGEELELSISGPLLPSKADGKADALNGRVVPQVDVRLPHDRMLRSEAP
jgi:hypothetical protein